MNFNRANSPVRALILSAMLMFAGSASAAMISGDINFSGSWETDGPLKDAVSIDFGNGDIDVDGSTGDFGGIAQGDMGTISSLDFSPFTPDGSIVVSIGGFDFVLDSLSVTAQTTTVLLLEGTGIVSGNGIMPTPVDFNLSANISGGLQNFSAGFTAQPIPVPGALLLLSSALAVLGIRRK